MSDHNETPLVILGCERREYHGNEGKHTAMFIACLLILSLLFTLLSLVFVPQPEPTQELESADRSMPMPAVAGGE